MKTKVSDSFHCHYHPNREATEKCEICNEMICLECVRSLEIRQNRGRSSYTYTKKVCPICYDDYYINQGPGQNIVGVIFPIFFIIVAASLVSSFENIPDDLPIVLFFVFFFSISLYHDYRFVIQYTCQNTSETPRMYG